MNGPRRKWKTYDSAGNEGRSGPVISRLRVARDQKSPINFSFLNELSTNYPIPTSRASRVIHYHTEEVS